MKRAKGKIVRYNKSKTRMIFYVRSMRHDGGSSGLIGFLQILKGLEAEGRPQDKAVLGACEPPHYEDMPKDIATQMASICSAQLSEDYRLPFGNRNNKGARYRPFFVSRRL